jgi:hypothetical protein
MFCSIYGIVVFYSAPFILIDSHDAFFPRPMLQCTLFFMFNVF